VSITLRDIFETRFELGGINDKMSVPLAKLLTIWVHQNEGVPILISDLAKTLGCGERTLYRVMGFMKDNSYIGERYNTDVKKFGFYLLALPTVPEHLRIPLGVVKVRCPFNERFSRV